jgi:parallel beta-helix repeat protein
LTGVSIDGPTTGYTDTLYAFTAAVVPTDATEPVSYTWTPTPAPGSLLLPKGSVVTYTWDLPGTYTLTVRAENCGGSEVATHTIAIGPLGHTIYLPLVLRGYEPPLAPDRYVRRYGSDSGDCSTADNACGSIQYAVDQAAEGDLIGIAGYEDAYTPENPDGSATRTYWYVEQHASPSGYGGPSQVRQAVYLDKTVALRGGYSSDFRQWDPATYKSVLRPGPSGFGGRVVFIDAGVHPTLEWLYIIEGSAVGQGGLYLDPYEDAGNGIFAWSTLTDIIDVTIRNCVIANNTGAVSSGGGVFLVYRNNATVADNVVQGNSAYRGGGISVNSSDDVVLSGNEVVANIATGQQAGGIYVVDSDDVRLTGNRVYSNTARQSGGGIEVRFSGNPQLIGNVVHDNVAALYSYGVGGGIDLFAIFEGFTVQDNHIYNNVATQYTGQGPYDTGIGGGIYLNEVENGMVSGNVITGNLSSQYHVGTGGGLSIYSSDVILVDGNVIHSNVATLNDDSGPSSTGGGIRVSYNSMDVTLSNNVIAGNRASAGGDGIDLVGSISQPVAASLLHNTIADNGTLGGLVRRSFTPAAEDALFPGWASVAPDGPALAEVRLLADARVVSIDGSGVTTQGKAQGILVEPYATLNAVNTILSGHTLGISVAHPASSTVGVDYTLWWDNTADYASGVAHSNDLSGDPAFMDPAAWDYHIGSDSAAIDQGMGAGVTTDFEGDTRPQGAGYDVGADEYTWALQRQ